MHWWQGLPRQVLTTHSHTHIFRHQLNRHWEHFGVKTLAQGARNFPISGQTAPPPDPQTSSAESYMTLRSLLSFSTSSNSLLTRPLLMYSSWQALPFSFLPPQAFRAEACRARPKEKVRAQGRCRKHWFMAFRLSVASSSLWPPDRKVTPVWGECIRGKS